MWFVVLTVILLVIVACGVTWNIRQDRLEAERRRLLAAQRAALAAINAETKRREALRKPKYGADNYEAKHL